MTVLNEDLRYGKKALITYTGLDGCEKAQVVELHWLKRMSQKKLKRLAFKPSFPFIGFEQVKYTDVLMNSGTDDFPGWIHMYAMESPRLMAKKFGIDYADIVVDRVKDDLENGI